MAIQDSYSHSLAAFNSPEIKDKLGEENGGFTGPAIRLAARQGACFENEIPSDDSIVPERFSELLTEKEKNFDREPHDQRTFWNFLFDARVNRDRSGTCSRAMEAGFKSLFGTVDDFDGILKKSLDPLKDFHQIKCAFKPKKTPQVRTRNYWFKPLDPEDRDEMIKTIEQQLSQNMPTAIAIDGQLFSQGGAAIKEYQQLHGIQPSRHEVLVIGQIYSCSGEKKLVVRNSWGPQSCKSQRRTYRSLPWTDPIMEHLKNDWTLQQLDCGKQQGDQKLRCQQEAENQAYERFKEVNPPPFECDDAGNYLVDQDALIESITETTTIE